MSLTTSLNNAANSLLVAEGAIQATNHNIANVNTPGYSREIVHLSENAPTGVGPGNGVVLQSYESVRNELLQMQIEHQTQTQSGVNAQLTSLQQIQPTFTTSTQDIGTQMSALFASLSSLSTNPSSPAQRQSVLTAGQNLATAFNTASAALTSQQTGLNTQVSHDVSQINQLTQQIAALNPQITTLQQTGQGAGQLQDQQDQLVLQLSKLTDVATTQTTNGITLTTGNGAPLVVGNNSYALSTTTDSHGMTRVLDNSGTDVTDSITGGDLGGTVQMRDSVIPGLLGQLDTLASQIGQAFNAAQAQGFDAKGNAGQTFFNLPSGTAGAAANISLALTDPSQVAASSDATAGSNGNLAAFASIQNIPLPSGATPTDAYANLVYQVGALTATAQAQSNASAASLTQLNAQRSSISGVSIDEESTNLLQFQQAYQAAARVVNTIQTLFQVTMAMGAN